MENTQSERRARMLEKVRKLMAMGRDDRGNATETETAMRQANILMAQFGIAEAEVDMQSMDSGAMVFGEVELGPDGRAPEAGKVSRQMPSYAGILSIGVARFCDSIATRRRGASGEILVFRGEREDVLFARWLFGVLIEAIGREQRASGWTKRGEANDFKVTAASTLARRLRALADERRAAYVEAQRESGSRALVVVDRKAIEIAQRFGTQKIRSTSGVQQSSASMAGRAAGSRINIPAGRPLGNQQRTAIGN